MKVIDSHCHIWGRAFLPPSFFHRAAEGWAQKVDGRTEDMILPKLLDGVVDETGEDFVKNMDTAGVDAALVMMVDAGTPLFGMEPATTIDRQVEYYAMLQERHRGRLFAHVCRRSSPRHLPVNYQPCCARPRLRWYRRNYARGIYCRQ